MAPDSTAKQRLSVVHGKPLGPDITADRQTIAAFAREVTGRWPEREALVAYDSDGSQRWSYADLWQHAMAIARALAAAGLTKGTRVGILMTNRPEFIASVFGISLAGGVVAALNTFATASELDYQIRTSSIDTLLFEPRVAKKDFGAILLKLEPAIGTATPGWLVSQRFPYLRNLVSVDDADVQATGITGWSDFLRNGQAIPEALIDEREAMLAPSDPAILFFSSGSTGQPKGILHNQRAVALQWRGWRAAMGYTGELRAWTANGFFWSGNFAMVIGSALSSGGAIVLQSGFDAREALELMVKERINAPFAMPHQWGRIAEEPHFAESDLSELRNFDPRFYGLQHPNMPTTFRQAQAFGCTETLTINTSTRFDDGTPTRSEGHGLPLPGNTLKIVDPLTGEIVPLGERGEIAVKGPTLMIGYVGKTAEECFDEEGFYHSGDGGYLDETGWLFWEGRLNDIIKTGGANVSPLEIDDIITTYPPIKANQTVGLPDDQLGEIVVSCIVPHDAAEFDESAFRDFLKERLASYKLPRRILVFSEDDMSLTGSGNKIKAAEVRKLAAERLAAIDAARAGDATRR